MKVICDRTALLDAINVVSAVVPSRTPRPQLMCVKLIASMDGDVGALTLAATDADTSIRLSTVQVEVQTPGEALVPAQKLQQIVAAEEDEPTLTLDVSEDVMEVRGADARFKIYGYSPADFPAMAEFPEGEATEGGNVFEIEAGEMQRLVTRTLFATARETSRYAINGVLMHLAGKKLEMVATDGRRLALARGAAQGASADSDFKCIIPTKGLALVNKLIEDSAERIRVAITDNQAYFQFSADARPWKATLSSALVEGSFPPYEEVIPKDQDKKAVFEVTTLRSGVRRAALLTNEESRGVKLQFAGDADKTLKLSSRAPEMGEAEVNIDIESYDGDQIEIGFNPSFITDALKVVEDAQVIIELKAPNKPGLLKSGNDFLYVVMPVSLQ